MSGGIVAPCPGEMASTSAKIDWYGTVRVRAGWAADRVLIYGTGGLAFGEVDLRSSFTTGGAPLNLQTSSVRAGWVLGAGVDYMLNANLFLSLLYEHVDLGTISLVATAPPLTETANAHAAFDVVTVGLNWLFFPMGERPASNPWQGPHIGGDAGGAWGLNTDATYSVAIPSDIRLKRDVVLVGRLPDGLGLYRYRYVWGDTVYVGVIAQEVALLHPDAIVRDPLDDYLRVNYRRLGLRLMTLPEWKAQSAGAKL